MSDTPALPPPLDDQAFDRALIAAVFRLAAVDGWRNVRIAAAAREASLPLARARLRFPTRGVVLVRFGRMADAAALAEPAAERPGEESVRDRLFGMLMRRLDLLQAHRDGVIALLRSLPFRPKTALFLGLLTERSMRWMLDASGVSTTGLAGRLRVRGLVGVWLWALRAWARDGTPDLGPTMAALDTALARAERSAGWLAFCPFGGAKPASEPPAPEPLAEEGPGAGESAAPKPANGPPPAS